jgi:hypothetical protein
MMPKFNDLKMKTSIIGLCCLFPILSMAQSPGLNKPDSTPIKSQSIQRDTLVPDRKYNAYGYLLNDDTLYNYKYHWLTPSLRVLASNGFNWTLARYFLKADWASNGPKDWKHNFQSKPEWDQDGFGVNFYGHPYAGNLYYNVARSNGYSFWQSIPFAVQGSLTWEYLGENTKPSWNDWINTPISGVFLGEVFYRLSSNILNDQSRGGERFFRELAAGLLNPSRALNRLTQGKMFRVTNREVYQKEPLNTTISTGVHKVNDKIASDNKFGTGSTNALLNLQLDYGDPFESRHRKPFDLFRLRIELSYGADRHLLDHINGYGILTGRNIKEDRLLAGLFQHYDYWRNNIFEVASIGLGGGLISKIPLTKQSNLFSNLHLAVVPLAGNNTQFGPDTSEFRHYNFGGGLEGKIEETLNIGKWGSFGFTGFYYWIHTYNGLPGNSLVGILKPTVTVKLYKNLRIGLEHHIYHNDRYLNGIPTLHVTRTEQKLFLQLYLQSKQRTDKYH